MGTSDPPTGVGKGGPPDCGGSAPAAPAIKAKKSPRCWLCGQEVHAGAVFCPFCHRPVSIVVGVRLVLGLMLKLLGAACFLTAVFGRQDTVDHLVHAVAPNVDMDSYGSAVSQALPVAGLVILAVGGVLSPTSAWKRRRL